MLEIAIVSVFVGIALVAVGRSTHPGVTAHAMTAATVFAPDDVATDLPCPWCLGPTHEDDRSCPSCGQPFG